MYQEDAIHVKITRTFIQNSFHVSQIPEYLRIKTPNRLSESQN